MTEALPFAHGQFSWVDLAAHDATIAREFYEQLFGWNTVDVDTHGGPPYAQFYLHGKTVAGMGQMPDEMLSQNIPPMWSSYINVDDISAIVQKVPELGGQVAMPVMQVLDFGWMAFLSDPSGGHVGLWQKNTHSGAELAGVPGTFCWNELATRDMQTAQTFFAKLLGWEYEDSPGGKHPYKIIKNQGRQIGGIIQMDQNWGESPPHWLVYFSVADIDTTAAKLKDLGGSICVPIFEIPSGRIAVVADPQGAAFTMMQFNLEACTFAKM